MLGPVFLLASSTSLHLPAQRLRKNEVAKHNPLVPSPRKGAPTGRTSLADLHKSYCSERHETLTLASIFSLKAKATRFTMSCLLTSLTGGGGRVSI